MKSFFRKVRHQAITKNLLIPNEALVLDTSCQDGGFLSVLIKNNADKNLKLYGVDISESDINKAKNLVPNGIFEIIDNKTLPFADKTFDIVISSLTLHHMNDPMGSSLGDETNDQRYRINLPYRYHGRRKAVRFNLEENQIP